MVTVSACFKRGALKLTLEVAHVALFPSDVSIMLNTGGANVQPTHIAL